MASVSDLSAEQVARLFYEYHEALAPDFQCSGQHPAASWQQLPPNERSRLVAAVRLALFEVASTGGENRNGRGRYFAKPGEAEWGC